MYSESVTSPAVTATVPHHYSLPQIGVNELNNRQGESLKYYDGWCCPYQKNSLYLRKTSLPVWIMMVRKIT